MAAVEITEETKQQAERVGQADVVVGIAGAVSADELRARAQQILSELGSGASSLRFVFAWPGVTPEAASSSAEPAENSALALVPFTPPAQGTGKYGPMFPPASAPCSLWPPPSKPRLHRRRSDLAALRTNLIQLFTYAVLDRQCGLVMPYPASKYDGLINSGILSLEPCALWQARSLSPRLRFRRLRRSVRGSGAYQPARRQPPARCCGRSRSPPLSFPRLPVGQVHVDVHHQVAARGPGAQRRPRPAGRLAVSGNGICARPTGSAFADRRLRPRGATPATADPMVGPSNRSPCSIRSCLALKASKKFGDCCCPPMLCSNCAA